MEALAGGDTHAAVRGLTARMKVMLRITLMRGERVRDRLAGSVDCLGQTIHATGRGADLVFLFFIDDGFLTSVYNTMRVHMTRFLAKAACHDFRGGRK